MVTLDLPDGGQHGPGQAGARLGGALIEREVLGRDVAERQGPGPNALGADRGQRPTARHRIECVGDLGELAAGVGQALPNRVQGGRPGGGRRGEGCALGDGAEVGRLQLLLRIPGPLLERSRADDFTRAGIQRAVMQQLAAIRSDLKDASDAASTRIAAIEDEVRLQSIDGPTLRRHDPAELAAIGEALEATQNDLAHIARSQQELAGSQRELHCKVLELDTRLMAAPVNGADAAPPNLAVDGVVPDAAVHLPKPIVTANGHARAVTKNGHPLTALTGVANGHAAPVDLQAALDQQLRNAERRLSLYRTADLSG